VSQVKESTGERVKNGLDLVDAVNAAIVIWLFAPLGISLRVQLVSGRLAE
jgi:hypothetical protein